MTLSNILVVDSSYRDTKVYPLNTSFEIPVNSPQQVTEYVDTPLIFFSWSQTQSSVTGTITGGSTTNIILSSEFYVGIYNYYIGNVIQFIDSSSDVIEASRVISYIPNTNTVILENAVTTDTISSATLVKINYFDSLSLPFHIQITGYVDGVISEYNHLYLYNRTKNLMFEISELDRYGFVSLSESMTDTYDLNDFFEIRNNSFHYKLSSSSYYISIFEYELLYELYNTVTYIPGEEVYILPDPSNTVLGTPDRPQIYRVLSIDPLQLTLVDYGGNYKLGNYYIVPERKLSDSYYTDCYQLSVVHVVATLDAMDLGIPSPSNHVLYIGNFRFGSLLYFVYSQFKNWIVVDNFDRYISILLYLSSLSTLLDIFFLTKVTENISSNVANSSFPNNPICLEISLESLILPNKYVKGYKQLLSFFPYVIVKLYNSSTANKSKNYSIISNNPTSSMSQFFCPIGNLLNPNIIRFVEISSNMTQSLQLNPNDNIFFQVCLPDGSILEYDENALAVLGSNPNILPNYTLVLEKRAGFTISNTVCAIFSLKITT